MRVSGVLRRRDWHGGRTSFIQLKDTDVTVCPLVFVIDPICGRTAPGIISLPMGATRNEHVPLGDAKTDVERQELDWLLASGVLGRSGNVARVVKYICEERFAGRSHLIKEYTIATEALGRRPDFDPNTDTIVRVTVHSLRKRLKAVYQNEGAARPLRLVVPPGHYDPAFVPTPRIESHDLALPQEPGASSESNGRGSVALEGVFQHLPLQASSKPFELWFIGAVALCMAIAASFVLVLRSHPANGLHVMNAVSPTAAMPLPAPQATIRALLGTNRPPYVDHSGVHWDTGNYCPRATNVLVPLQKIVGTLDAPLYLGGVRGLVQCIFPVKQKLYEVHLYFAETSNLPAATRVASFSINSGPGIVVDVVNDAGGDGIATSTVVAGVVPESDGAIHLDFSSEVSPLTAVEILPSPSPSQLPVRFVMNSKSIVDSANQLWLSDRYFSGGRYGVSPDFAKRENLGLYESGRIGSFRYSIPVVPLARYRVRLYFRELWFAKENGGTGGLGSRIFNVTCNGQLLLKNFDIIAESSSATIVRTFGDIQATAGGRIELSFTSVVNYAIINAIEVLPAN